MASPTEHTFASGAADNLKKFKLPQGDFLHNFLQQQRVSTWARAARCSRLRVPTPPRNHRVHCRGWVPLSAQYHYPSPSQAIVNCMAANQDGVLASGALPCCPVLACAASATLAATMCSNQALCMMVAGAAVSHALLRRVTAFLLGACRR